LQRLCKHFGEEEAGSVCEQSLTSNMKSMQVDHAALTEVVGARRCSSTSTTHLQTRVPLSENRRHCARMQLHTTAVTRDQLAESDGKAHHRPVAFAHCASALFHQALWRGHHRQRDTCTENTQSI
jgi:hypothetical protein